MGIPPRSRADGVGLELLEIITEKYLDPETPLLGIHAKVTTWESMVGGWSLRTRMSLEGLFVRPPKMANTEGMAKESLHNHNMKFFFKSRGVLF